MYTSKKPIAPGTAARVEVDARIVARVEGNPYWYLVEFADQAREVVSVDRITVYPDEPRPVLEANGDITILQPRLSAVGALNLYHWLGCNLDLLQEQAGQTSAATIEAAPGAESEVSPG